MKASDEPMLDPQMTCWWPHDRGQILKNGLTIYWSLLSLRNGYCAVWRANGPNRHKHSIGTNPFLSDDLGLKKATKHWNEKWHFNGIFITGSTESCQNDENLIKMTFPYQWTLRITPHNSFLLTAPSCYLNQYRFTINKIQTDTPQYISAEIVILFNIKFVNEKNDILSSDTNLSWMQLWPHTKPVFITFIVPRLRLLNTGVHIAWLD